MFVPNIPRGVAIFRTLIFGFTEINEEVTTILTRLAKVNLCHASLIVDILESRLEKSHIEILLPLLFVVDSILKNVRGEYVTLISNVLIKWLEMILPQLSDDDKLKMMVLRSTWNKILSPKLLYNLDARLNAIHPAWTVSSGTPSSLPEADSENVQMEFLEMEKMRVEKELAETERLLLEVESTNSPSLVSSRLQGSFGKDSSSSSHHPSELSETAALPDDVPPSKYARLPLEAVSTDSQLRPNDKVKRKIPRTTIECDLLIRNKFSTATEVHPPDPSQLNAIEVPTTHLMIDGRQKKIRFYWGTSVAFEGDDPQELTFVNGARTIIINDRYSQRLHLNEPAVRISVGNLTCDIRLGSPSRELCINGHFYPAVFDGPPTYVRVGESVHKFILLGPPPNVTRGPSRRDLVAGCIHVIINGKDVWPIYLDAKPQRFDVNGVPFILQFVNRLQGLVVNGVPVELDMNAIPVEVSYGGRRYYFTFSPLPKHVIPGKVYLRRMPSGIKCIRQISTPPAKLHFSHAISTPFANPMPPRNWSQTSKITPVQGINRLDVKELYKKLQDAGLVPRRPPTADSSSQSKTVSFDDVPSLRKTRQPDLINQLYSGLQCSHCTLRFSASAKQEYTDHLNKHAKEIDSSNQGSESSEGSESFLKVSDWKTYKMKQPNTCTDQNQNESIKALKTSKTLKLRN